MQHRLLIVDSDHDRRVSLSNRLKADGLVVLAAQSLSDMWLILHGQGYGFSLVLLGLPLPDGDGIAACRKIRQKTRSDLGIIMIAKPSSPDDRIRGLDGGADDFLSEPFDMKELVARVQTTLRRIEPPKQGPMHQTYRFDGWTFRPSEWMISHQNGDMPIRLTQYESHLLEKLVKGHGRALTRDELCIAIAGRHHSPLDRSIDNIVSRIRKKISLDPGSVSRIKPVRGQGYRFSGDIECIQ